MSKDAAAHWRTAIGHFTLTGQLDWAAQSPSTAPDTTSGAAGAYDPVHDQTVLFGGCGTACASAATWIFAAGQWTQASPATSPPARLDASLAYSSSAGGLVLFGGNTAAGDLQDTWVWTGSNWEQRFPAYSPERRHRAALARNASENSSLVLYGGYTNDGQLNDTWTYDGTNWALLKPATNPGFRAAAGFAYDQNAARTVLFGGEVYDCAASNCRGSASSTTWEWSGSDWQQAQPTNTPAARRGLGLAEDPASGGVTLFGGSDDSYRSYSDTWVWLGDDWSQQAPVRAPDPRDDLMMVGQGTGHVFLFGGVGANGGVADSWKFGT